MLKPLICKIAAFIEAARWIVILLIFCAMGGFFYYAHHDDDANATILPLPHSEWVVYGYPGHKEGWINAIVARNQKTGESIRIATMQDDANFWFDASNTLVIAVGRFKSMKEMSNSFAGHPVVYQFWAEDAAQQASYQFWLHHPNDIKTTEWCARNFSSKDICKQ